MTIEFRLVNIFIGDQSTGKSTVSKLLFVIKEMLSIGNRNNKEQKSDWNLIHFNEQLEFVGITNYIDSKSFIEFSDSFGYFKLNNQNIEIREMKREGKNKATYLAGFIPSYREALPLLKGSLHAISLTSTTLPKLFHFFGQKFDNAKIKKPIYNYNHILGVDYKFENGRDVIIMKNGKEISILEASSAINSAIPLLLVFDDAVELMKPSNRVYHKKNQPYLIIEEPELNCFPTTQQKIVEHFVSKIKFEENSESGYYLRLVVTTHSPYILTSLNNLMYAYEVGQKEPSEVNKIIDKKYWINPDDVSAYMLLPDGRSKDILDRKEKLIKAEKIDSVSEILNKQFDALLNIELVPK